MMKILRVRGKKMAKIDFKQAFLVIFYLSISFSIAFGEPNEPIPGDISLNGKVDFNDFAILASQWLNSSNLEPNIPQGWPIQYNGPSNKIDSANSMAIDKEGNVYVTGESTGSETGYDFATIKYDPDGNQLWVSRYNGPSNSDDRAPFIVIDNSGNIYVTGHSYDSSTDWDYATIKYDTNGNQLWVSRYNSSGNNSDYPKGLALDGFGNIYVTGFIPDVLHMYYDIATIKYSPDGNQIWAARYNGPANMEDWANDITTDIYDNIYVTGYSFSTTDKDFTTIKYAPDGNQLWVARYNRVPGSPSSSCVANSIISDKYGNIYVTGYSQYWKSEAGAFVSDYTTIKYDTNGTQLWLASYDGPDSNYDAASDVITDKSGNIYVTGASYGLATNYDYVTVKYDPNGNQLWASRYNGPGNGSDKATKLTLDSLGNVYVIGNSYGSGTGLDFATVKYDPNGNLIWVARFNGSLSLDDNPHDIITDISGNVYVTGQGRNFPSYDYVTIKYSQDCHCQTDYSGNLNGDCKVDIADLALFVQNWLSESF
jgi:uncharacterized delta-60 repeat protein